MQNNRLNSLSNMNSGYTCVVSGKPIPEERVAAMRDLGIPESQWTVVQHGLTQRKQGIFMGEVGTSKLLICDKVYDDSVRAVFRRATRDASKTSTDPEEVEVEEPEKSYDLRELEYYTQAEEVTDNHEKDAIAKRHTV